MERSQKPSAYVKSITIYNTMDERNQWIPLTIVGGSWVLMQARRRKRRSTNKFLNSWKGRVKNFKLGENRKTVKEVLIQHVYMHRELKLEERPQNLALHRPNCELLNLLFLKDILIACSFIG